MEGGGKSGRGMMGEGKVRGWGHTGGRRGTKRAAGRRDETQWAGKFEMRREKRGDEGGKDTETVGNVSQKVK